MRVVLTIFLSVISQVVLAAPPWYVTKVVEVTTQIDGRLYIRTEENPNPANCPAVWAGARWGGNDQSISLAASIALSSKVAKTDIRYQIDDQSCTSGGFPKILWLQAR